MCTEVLVRLFVHFNISSTCFPGWPPPPSTILGERELERNSYCFPGCGQMAPGSESCVGFLYVDGGTESSGLKALDPDQVFFHRLHGYAPSRSLSIHSFPRRSLSSGSSSIFLYPWPAFLKSRNLFGNVFAPKTRDRIAGCRFFCGLKWKRHRTYILPTGLYYE